MKMPIVNFDEHFAEYVSEWMKLHQNEYSNFDEMEENMPRVYMNFLNTRAKWLGNVTPGAYFTQFEDPKVLVDWMNQYCEERALICKNGQREHRLRHEHAGGQLRPSAAEHDRGEDHQQDKGNPA